MKQKISFVTTVLANNTIYQLIYDFHTLQKEDIRLASLPNKDCTKANIVPYKRYFSSPAIISTVSIISTVWENLKIPLL